MKLSGSMKVHREHRDWNLFPVHLTKTSKRRADGLSQTITCVLGNQTYRTLDIDGRKLLVILGRMTDVQYAIIPGWYSGNEQYDKGQLAAIDVELIDPIDQISLENRIKSEIGRITHDTARISFWGSGGISEESETSKRSTILVVDDDPVLRDLIRKYLEREGYKVETAANSSEAMLTLGTKELPSLMLLDIMMPGETGWQLLKNLEKDPKFALLPVVAISGLEKPSREDAEHDSKMLYDYLVKPFSLAELSRVLRKFASAG